MCYPRQRCRGLKELRAGAICTLKVLLCNLTRYVLWGSNIVLFCLFHLIHTERTQSGWWEMLGSSFNLGRLQRAPWMAAFLLQPHLMVSAESLQEGSSFLADCKSSPQLQPNCGLGRSLLKCFTIHKTIPCLNHDMEACMLRAGTKHKQLGPLEPTPLSCWYFFLSCALISPVPFWQRGKPVPALYKCPVLVQPFSMSVFKARML